MAIKGPAPQCIEVSIFGIGYGESILIHLGFGDWMIVDSCRASGGGSVPVLDYMRRIGADPSKDVRLVVCTHAHDDHMKGMSQIVSECTSAFFAYSSSLDRSQFAELIMRDHALNLDYRRGIYTEYKAIFDTLRRRGLSATGEAYVIRAVQKLELLNLNRADSAAAVRVLALSPSHMAVTKANEALADSVARSVEGRKPSAFDENEVAVALWVQIGAKAVLLGADLPHGPGGCGWQGVLAWHAPTSAAAVFKAAHHGSYTGDHSDVWTRYLDPEPVVLMAPFQRGSQNLPSDADRKRICSYTSRAYVAAPIESTAAASAVRKTSRALVGVASKVSAIDNRLGHVRARSLIGQMEWTVQTFGSALQLTAT